jgi:hypothetical protein
MHGLHFQHISIQTPFHSLKENTYQNNKLCLVGKYFILTWFFILNTGLRAWLKWWRPRVQSPIPRNYPPPKEEKIKQNKLHKIPYNKNWVS